MKVYKRTLTKLRVISALRDERMMQLLDRLTDEELNRLRSEGHRVTLSDAS